MRILYLVLLLVWNLAVLGGLILLLLSDLDWATNLLALFFVPLAMMTGYSALRGLLKRGLPDV